MIKRGKVLTPNIVAKFSYSEKVTKIWGNLQTFFTILSNFCGHLIISTYLGCSIIASTLHIWNDVLTRQVSLFNMKNICKIFEKMADSSQLIISLILPFLREILPSTRTREVLMDSDHDGFMLSWNITKSLSEMTPAFKSIMGTIEI